jgi:hypothetical protein
MRFLHGQRTHATSIDLIEGNSSMLQISLEEISIRGSRPAYIRYCLCIKHPRKTKKTKQNTICSPVKLGYQPSFEKT